MRAVSDEDMTASSPGQSAIPDSMHPGHDSISAPPSFAARRPHAAQLEPFELPPASVYRHPLTSHSQASEASHKPTTLASIGNPLAPSGTLTVEEDHSTYQPPSHGYEPSGTSHYSKLPYSIGASPTQQHSQSKTNAQSPSYYQQPPSPWSAPVRAQMYQNVQNPNGQLALVGRHPAMFPGFNGRVAAQIPHLLAGQLSLSNDQPFKCDQCPQRFNRNHDLKRHKRIHLTVKPFPCAHCGKTFSRKDALKRHKLVKGCGKRDPNSDEIRREAGLPTASQMENVVSRSSYDSTPEHGSSPSLEPYNLSQEHMALDKVEILHQTDEDDDPFSSAQEPTVSTIVKVLERILDAANRSSPNNLEEYVEAWTGLDLHGTELLRQLCSPTGFVSSASRTKAVTRYVHTVLVMAQWRDCVRSRNGRQSSSRVKASMHAPSKQVDKDQSPRSFGKELRLTALPKSLEELWGCEVIDRTIDAFLYRWNPEHQRWLQYHWDAACAVYYCRLRIDNQRWKYLDWNGIEFHKVIANVIASSQANANELPFHGEHWFSNTDTEERRRLQNRIAQRNYRKKLRARLLELEEKAYANTRVENDSTGTSPSAGREEHNDPEVMVYQNADEAVNMSCICESSSDHRFIIACLSCGTWQHIACYYQSAKDYMDEHQCVQCSPRLVEPKIPSSKRPANVAFSVHSSSTEYRSKRQARTLGASSSIGLHEREGSETAGTEFTTYNDHDQPATGTTAIKGLELRSLPAKASTSVDARELERVQEMGSKAGTHSAAYVIECPLSAAESDLGLASTCSDLQAGNMAQIRIHLVRRHAMHVQLCNVCLKTLLDPQMYDLYHGSHCTDARPYRRDIAFVRLQWRDLYMSLRQKMDISAMEVSKDAHPQEVDMGPSRDTDVEARISPSRTTNQLSREQGGCEDSIATSESDRADTETVCSCSSSTEVATGIAGSHVLVELAEKLPSAWEEIQDQLPDSYKWDIEYVTTHDEGATGSGCWTCMPLQDGEPEQIPLTIAEAPVVLPVEYRWPPIGGVNPPPDPRPLAMIDCRSQLPLDTIRDLFLTFEDSLGFYVLISGLLQIIVPETFDTIWASSHLPHKYGGLKVCYIVNTMEPTMLQSHVATPPLISEALQVQTSRPSSMSRQARSTQSLQINDFIEARVKSTSREKYAGRIGLKVAKDGQTYLIMSSHVITEAILSKSFFGLSRDPLKRLQEDWNANAEIFAGNAKIGTIERSFDRAAEYYPTGFNHDVTLIKPSAAASIADVKSPIVSLGWLCRDAWSSLRQQPAAVKILGPTESDRRTKCIKCDTPSKAIIVGEGIFLNLTTAGGAKPSKDHDASTWKKFVSRAVLYRVNPDFDPPNGYSGIALYADGEREDGTQGPGIVGFQSFVQRSGHTQNFNMPEGPHLERRLKEGIVAFYGAFQVPDELRKEYVIL